MVVSSVDAEDFVISSGPDEPTRYFFTSSSKCIFFGCGSGTLQQQCAMSRRYASLPCVWLLSFHSVFYFFFDELLKISE